MKHISIPKIGLGILLTLVLAFSVRGNLADALTFGNHSSNDGDLRTVYQNQEFTIRVPITLKGAARIPGFKPVPSTDESETPVSVPAAERTNMFYDDDPDIDYIHNSTDRVNYDGAHYYDQEQITITVIGNAAIKKVGSHNVPSTRAPGLTMYESSHDSYDTAANDQRFSGSITLTLEPTGVGTVVVSVADSTAAADNRGGAQSGLRMAYTVYVVNYKTTPAAELGFDTATITTNTNYSVGRDDSHDSPVEITVTPAGNTPVTLEVVDGPGQFYVQKGYTGVNAGAPMSRGSSSRSLETSSNAATGDDTGSNVYLDMRGGTNRVTIKAPGTTVSPVTAIFVYGYPRMEIVSGDGQGGATGGRLADPLVVRVRDEKNRGIPMALVTFSSNNGTDTNERFLPVPGTIVHVDSSDNWASAFGDIEDINDPVTATSIYPMTVSGMPDDPVLVQTDRSGDAKVYFQLGSTASSQSVSATAAGASPITFRATATTVVSTNAATITIVDGDGQRATVDEPLDDPLIVLVRDSGGRIVADAPVTFTTNSGELSGPEPGDPGEEIDDSPDDVPDHTALFIVVNTDATGQASVRYNVGDLPGAKQVFARIDISNGRTRTKTFNINGRAASPRDDPADDDDDDEPSSVTVRVPTSVTGTAGSTTTLRVTAPATARVIIGSLNDTLPTGSASPGRFTGSGTSTLTLPSTARTYTLTVFVDNTEYPVSVVVNQAARETGTVSVSISPGSGAPGTQSTVTVTAVNSNNQPANISVTLRVTSGGGTFPNGTTTTTVSTGTTGTGTTTLTRGSTPGTNYFITATPPDGYTSSGPASGERLIISGTSPEPPEPPEPPQTAGEADSIEIEGARSIRGTLAEATPLRARVLDANNSGVSDVRVTFRVIAPGQGTFAGARGSGRAIIIETDRNGYVNTNFTPTRATSTGTITVEAKAAGVTGVVTFIIDVGEGTTPTGTDDTAAPQTYKVGDKIPVSLQGTLNFTGSRTVNGITYTCVGPGECVISYGLVAKGQIRSEAQKPAAEYKVGDKIPVSLEGTLNFAGSHAVNGTVYTCTSEEECVISYGLVTRGEIRSEAQKPGTGDTPSTIHPVVKVAAANRPVIYWIAGGALYRLAGSSAEQIAERATDVAVGQDTLYWIEQTSERTGAIHRANLDGSNASVLKTLTSVPKGLTIDPANAKLYLTNGWGKIQRINVDGTQFETNFLTNLGAPLRLAVSGSRVYWTDGSGRVRSAPLRGTKTIQNIVTGSGTLGGIVVDASKVYWTEQTGPRSGRVRSANLEGTDITDAYTVTATVHGIAIDPTNNQLYWTNGWGKVQRGTPRRGDVVTGLMTTTALAIGGANTATPTPTASPETTPRSEPNYDVDGSGTVDNADLFLVSLAVGTSNATYDVNGDGTVDDKDISLVRDNRDDGAAAAPMVFGVKLNAEQVSRLQEQIDLLIASGDRSPAALKTLVYLQQLIATARPEKTQLLANYPNPFNPETWMPYELATDTDVRITIYNAQGVVVRTLQLGQQSAGYYTDRERAAYWDGRNAHGETVASGVYFYQLETDEISSLRKMVILK